MSNNRAEMDDFKKLEALWNQIKSGDDIEGVPESPAPDKKEYPVAERVDDAKNQDVKAVAEENEGPVAELPADGPEEKVPATDEAPAAEDVAPDEEAAEPSVPQPTPVPRLDPEGGGTVEEEASGEGPHEQEPVSVESERGISAEPVVFPAGALKERQESASSSSGALKFPPAAGIRSMRILFGAESSDWKLYLTGSDMSEIELNILNVREKKQIEIDNLSFVFGSNEVEVKDSGKASKAFDSMTFLSDSGEFIFDVASENNALQTKGSRMQQLILEDVMFRISPSEVHIRIES